MDFMDSIEVEAVQFAQVKLYASNISLLAKIIMKGHIHVHENIITVMFGCSFQNNITKLKKQGNVEPQLT